MIPAEIVSRARDMSIVDVALALGAAEGCKIDERGVPCPCCGGRDRFSLDKGKNVFLCRASSAGGDPIALVQHVHQCSFAEAIEQLTGEKPIAAARRAPAQSDDDKNEWREKARRRAWKIWQNGTPIEPERGGHWLRDYFALRAIPFPSWRIRALREMSSLAYWHRAKTGDEFKVIHTGPAMLAAITGPATPEYPTGHFIGVHRTWLDLSRANGKAAISDPATGDLLDAKKVEGSQKGGKIVLFEGQPGGGCVLGEGIETVLSWASLHRSQNGDCALWCGLNIGNIAGKAAEQIPHPSLTMTDRIGRKRRQKVGGHEPDLTDTDCLQIPADDFERLILLGDGDSDRFTTQAAMMRARNRFELTGHDAVIDWAPDGMDFNDVLRDRARLISPLEGEMSAKPTEGVAGHQALAPSGPQPVEPTPSALPGISPSRGETDCIDAGAKTGRAA
ncbi:DUF7146 domain-containing protein [Mesorhizobium opportunistum]|uniref:P4 alpha zinc-binding domain protein n=1 Tax=Mesorhizobium opportunistum (strain LMG 24607 / HAMBI 3007 / WSM2075) TaxID=536019 RepID=F7XZV6_MESOW|nr:primase-helicase zinc-binding domain-containing protein [Mesorhizobium opportunistum]AEH88170.1 P4 alpha zinc-binding domain protein [Mesorhizobium opportunistum WSM2075]